MWWRTALRALAGLLVVYAALLGLLFAYARAHPDTVTARDALRLLPDVIRLVRRLAADPTVPRTVESDWSCCWRTSPAPSTWSPTSSPSSATPTTQSSSRSSCDPSSTTPAQSHSPDTGPAPPPDSPSSASSPACPSHGA